MNNTGAGTAKNVRITSGQPKIVENEKGLLIDFVIIGTKVGARSYSPSLTVNLGDLGPGQTNVAQWLMTSSLEGKFIEFAASLEHVTALGQNQALAVENDPLSLVDSLEIHALTHVVRMDQPEDDGLPDFLADDTPDAENLPDMLYASDGGDALLVTAVTSGTFDVSPRRRT
jgi:hypothetical protein